MAKSRRGFASMSQEKRSSIAKQGGIKAHKLGKAHRYSHEEAVINGRKGGKSRWKSRKAAA